MGSQITKEEKPSVYAAEGTEAHKLSEELFADPNREYFDEYSEEMNSYVRDYFDYVISHLEDNAEIYTEVKLDLRRYIKDGFGTSDNVIVDATNETLHVFDLKYGKGVKVYADNNSQGRIYAIGALLAFDKKKKIKKVVIHIGQPRINHFDKEELTAKELMNFAKKVKVAARRTEEFDAPLVPGEEQCRWCRANAECTALRDFTFETISQEFEDLDTELMTADELSDILMQKKLIESFLKNVEERVTELLIEGDDVPGFEIGFGRSNRKWDDTAEEFLVEQLGKDAYQKSLITLSKAEKLLDKNLIAKHTVKPQGKIIAVIK